MDEIETPMKLYSSASPVLNSVREFIRARRLALSTERSYLYYVTDFFRFHENSTRNAYFSNLEPRV